MKPREPRINVPKLIAAHAHEENPSFTPKQKRAIISYTNRMEKKKAGGKRGK